MCCGAEASLLLDELGAVWSWGADWAAPTPTEASGRRSTEDAATSALSASPVRRLPLTLTLTLT